MSKSVFEFSKNTVDGSNAFRQAIESGLDVVHTIMELIKNSSDYGRNIKVILYGDSIKKDKIHHFINLKKICIEDDGCGMSHDTVIQRFRNAYQDSDSHIASDQSGRNGVGVKTNFQHWNCIEVETTTKEFIPTIWDCKEESLDEIEESFRLFSKLDHGDPDTEIRKYEITATDTSCVKEWESCNHIESFTRVTLINPRSKKLKIDLNELIKRCSRCVDFLIAKEGSITIHYPLENGKGSTSISIKPLNLQRNPANFICHASGSSDKDCHITVLGKQSVLFPKSDDTLLQQVDFDIKIVEGGRENDFVLSICGADVYQKPVDIIIDMGSIKNTAGFNCLVHGYVKTRDPMLKQALRFNKTALDLDNDRVTRFFNYIHSLFKTLNDIYSDYLNDFNIDQTDKITGEVVKRLNRLVFDRHIIDPNIESVDYSNEDETDNSVLKRNKVKFKSFICNECHQTWKVPKNKTPNYCAEYDIDGSEGCGSNDIEPKTSTKKPSLSIEWRPFLGEFIPARFDKNSGVILLSANHPAFITSRSGLKEVEFLKGAMWRESLIALSVATSIDLSIFERTYANNLKIDFHSSSDTAHINACQKKWKKTSEEMAMKGIKFDSSMV